MPPLDLARIEAALAPTRFAGRITHLPTVSSTNTLALEAAQSGVPTCVWVADEQTAGRGRGGHTWHSTLGTSAQPDGLYLSVLIRPALPLSRALWLSLATGLAAQHAIGATTGLTPDLRWPNDLMVAQPDGLSRKLGGILVETASDPATPAQPATLRYAVIGIGINLNQRGFPPELESLATSIARETGAPQLREALLIALLTALDREIALLESDPAPDLLTRFTAASTWVTGKRVYIQPTDTGPGYTGTTAGLDAHGFLFVRDDDGSLRTVLSGGVREP